MQELTKQELKNVNGGGVGSFLLIGAAVVFIIGIIDGMVRPLKCRY